MKLAEIEGRFAVCRLGPSDPVPPDLDPGSFLSITRTADELSIVCPESAVPPGVPTERGWIAIRVAGDLDFALTGVLASLAVPLAEAGVPIFVISTFRTDYLLIRHDQREAARRALEGAGHQWTTLPGSISPLLR